MYLEKQTFFVFGLSRSGKAAAEFLRRQNATVYIYDDTLEGNVQKIVEDLKSLGAVWIEKEEISRMHEKCDALVLSPGIPIDHPIAVAFKRHKKAVIGETELAARRMRCPVVAVTGTNGKTTTVSMIGHVLEKGGRTARCCGNIGTPMIEYADLSEREIAVAEISSFQLETLSSFCPHIAVVLNITEDHLNRHYNMENYIFLKGKLLKNETETEYAVLNYDDLTVRGFAQRSKAQIYYFSMKERVHGGCVSEGYLCFGEEKILPVSDLQIDGNHNIANALACITVCKILGVSTEEIQNGLRSFKGIKHRIEFIGEVEGVKYIDDSKGTNVDATLKAVECMKEKTVLLLGGKDKGYDYTNLFVFLPKSEVRLVVFYGENRYAIAENALKVGYKNFLLCSDFSMAVDIARRSAKAGENVLLSPASASFDEFSGYEERGDRFVAFVKEFERESQLRKCLQSDEEQSSDGERGAEEEQE